VGQVVRALRSTEVRLALISLLTALLPLMAAVWLANTMFRSASQVWTKPEVGVELDRGALLYKDYVSALKQKFHAEAQSAALDPELRELFRQRSAPLPVHVALGNLRSMARAEVPALIQKRIHQDLATRLRKIQANLADAVALEIRQNNGELIVTSATTDALNAVQGKRIDERVPLDAEGIYILTVSFATTKVDSERVENTARIASEYQQLESARSEIYSGYLRAFALLLGITIAVTALLGYVLARGITKRIRRLERASRRVAAGDLAVQVPVTGSDELTELASTFNAMIRDLAASRTRINFLKRMEAWQEMSQRLAHEIKNPLTPIQLSVQECQRKYSRAEPEFALLLDRTASIVEEEVASLRRFVTHFSSFARLPQSKRVQGDLRAFLNDIREQVDSEVTHGESGSGATLWSIPGDAAPARFDSQMLRRVLVNLVQNAWDATSTNTSAVRKVSVSLEAETSGYVVAIADNGPGIPSAEHEKIFDPYVTSKANGNGLGLAITKKIVIEHDGTIEVSASEKLGGACVRVHLPRAT
jgi:two-component system, NtrC family, nitrogen regulation sensor histidine kinase NtrY